MVNVKYPVMTNITPKNKPGMALRYLKTKWCGLLAKIDYGQVSMDNKCGKWTYKECQ